MLIKTKEEIEIMAEAGRRLARILDELVKAVVPGIRTEELEKMSRRLIQEAGAEPAFLGYRATPHDKPFPAALCVSVNDTVVHGVPGPYVIREGDVAKLDLGLRYKRFYVDSARTVGVGVLIPEARRLIRVTEEACARGIAEARPGNTVGDIGAAISDVVRGEGFSVADSLSGHGIGKALHEDPSVANRGERGKGIELQAGMVLAIEPMVAMGKGAVRELPDGSYAMKDGSLAAHVEHTVAITEQGPRILTIDSSK